MSYRFSLEEIESAIFEGTTGFCTECGEPQDGCEPDACNYLCESCGKRQVFGAEELLIMGLVD